MGKRASCECGHERLGLRIERGVLRWPHARGSAHRLRRPPGWAIQADVLRYHLARGDVERVEVHDDETQTTYTAGLSDVIRRGAEIERGFGKQIMLPLASWHIAGQGETVSASSAGADLQLTLFDMGRRPE